MKHERKEYNADVRIGYKYSHKTETYYYEYVLAHEGAGSDDWPTVNFCPWCGEKLEILDEA